MLAGLVPMAIAFGWVPVKPGTLHVPAWIAMLAGSAFVLAGALIWLPQRLSGSRELLGAMLITTFAVVIDWSAFAPGERHFGGSLCGRSADRSLAPGQTPRDV